MSAGIFRIWCVMCVCMYVCTCVYGHNIDIHKGGEKGNGSIFRVTNEKFLRENTAVERSNEREKRKQIYND